MEREIKFRGLTVGGFWVTGLLSISQGFISQAKQGYYISNRAFSPWAYQIRPETLGQYSGLKDKNGKEIYEGDILHQIAEAKYGYPVPGQDIYREVKFGRICLRNDSLYIFNAFYCDDNESISYYLSQGAVVIGNKFEHLHL